MLKSTAGTGKTFIVQSIADMLGSKLVVINLNQQVLPPLNQSPPFIFNHFSFKTPLLHSTISHSNSRPFLVPFQTDSSDLLGNWKPVDIRVLIRPVVAEFESLFESTLSSRANAELLTQLRLRLDRGKHSDCIKIMSKGTVTPYFQRPFALMLLRFQGCDGPHFEEKIRWKIIGGSR